MEFQEPKKRKQESLDDEIDYQMSDTTLKKILLQLEKNTDQNIELRGKYPSEPERFMDSEIELHATIKKLQALSATPEYFPSFVKFGGVTMLINLLGHENSDPSSFDDEKNRVLLDVLVKEGVVVRIAKLLEKLGVDDVIDQECVHDCLEIIENLVELTSEAVTQLSKTNLIGWLLETLAVDEYSANKLYCSELLGILTGKGPVKTLFEKDYHLLSLMKIISHYRKKKPNSTEETEIMHNVFDSLSSLLMENTVQNLFLEFDGIELLDILIREKKYTREIATKALNFSTLGNGKCALQLIQLRVFKTIFPLLMSIQEKDSEHLVSLLFTLMKVWEEDRFIHKFFENDFEKTDRIIELFLYFSAEVIKFDVEIEAGILNELYDDVDEDIVYFERVNHGLQSLQQIAHIFVVACKDTRVRDRVALLLSQRGLDLSSIQDVLTEYNSRTGLKLTL